MSSQHQHLRFENCGISKWNVHRHLVTVEIGVERCTHKRMKLNCFSFDEFWLESLNTQSVQCRSTIQKNRMSTQNIFKNIPNHSVFSVNDFFRRLYRFHNSALDEFANDKRFEKFGCHVFRQTAFVQFQFWSNDDY